MKSIFPAADFFKDKKNGSFVSMSGGATGAISDKIQSFWETSKLVLLHVESTPDSNRIKSLKCLSGNSRILQFSSVFDLDRLLGVERKGASPELLLFRALEQFAEDSVEYLVWAGAENLSPAFVVQFSKLLEANGFPLKHLLMSTKDLPLDVPKLQAAKIFTGEHEQDPFEDAGHWSAILRATGDAEDFRSVRIEDLSLFRQQALKELLVSLDTSSRQIKNSPSLQSLRMSALFAIGHRAEALELASEQALFFSKSIDSEELGEFWLELLRLHNRNENFEELLELYAGLEVGSNIILRLKFEHEVLLAKQRLAEELLRGDWQSHLEKCRSLVSSDSSIDREMLFASGLFQFARALEVEGLGAEARTMY